MDVGDDRDAHRRRTLAERLAPAAAGAVWIVSGLLLWRTEVPRLDLPALAPVDYFPADVLERAEDFRRVTRVLLLAALAVELVVLGVLVWKAGALADLVSRVAQGRLRTGIALGLLAVFSVWLATLPLHGVGHWWRRRYGLSEQGYAGWLRDEAVSLGLRALLVAIAVVGVLWLAARLGDSWWLVGGPALAAIGVLFVLAQPLVIDPLFNRFRPLEDRSLRAEIEAVATREGVRVGDVRVAEASRRTTTANAYVAGIGPTKRVVLYDTLLDGRFSRGEIVSVSAHELAHVSRSHLWKGLAWFALLAVPGVFVVAWVTGRHGGLAEPRLLPLALLTAFLFMLVTLPLQNAVSRRYEAEADWLALRATGDAESQIELDRRLARTSLNHPEPPGWVTVVFGTHPPTMERIAMAVAFERRVGR